MQCSAVQCSAVPFGTAAGFGLQKYRLPWHRASESAKPVSLPVTSHAARYAGIVLCQTGHIEVTMCGRPDHNRLYSFGDLNSFLLDQE
jgi:hypothetical protein